MSHAAARPPHAASIPASSSRALCSHAGGAASACSGAAGAKTSTIAAIATRMKRNICRVNLVAPRLCDDSLLRAINSVKKRSIVVMEDMDALFDHREKNDPSQRVTFSGLLNAIDGLNDHAGGGLIYLFTSNHPDKLDPALRRKGRIDLELHLDLLHAALEALHAALRGVA